MRLLNRLAVPAFEVLARRRTARAFHPRGALFAARVELTGRSATVTALGGPAERPALARVSKGVGTRGSRRDLLGLAVRLTDVPDGPVDLLFSTVGRHTGTRALFSFVTGWCARPYSTVLPYRADGVLVRLGLEPEEPDRARGTDPQVARDAVRRAPLRFRLVEKPRGTGWAPIGRVLLDLPLPDGAQDDEPGAIEPVAFDPVVNAHPRLRPVRPLASLRAAAYTGSRRGRDAEEPAEPLSGKPRSGSVLS